MFFRRGQAGFFAGRPLRSLFINHYLRGTSMGEDNFMIEENLLNLGEAPIEPTTEGHREELVELADIKLVDEMTKDQLQEYAITRLSTDLNLSDRVKLLRTKVILMIRERLKAEKEPDPTATVENYHNGMAKAIGNQPEFILNPKNRGVYQWTPALGSRIDYVPCWLVDIKGNRL